MHHVFAMQQVCCGVLCTKSIGTPLLDPDGKLIDYKGEINLLYALIVLCFLSCLV
jgi:hypothetical protein